MNWINKELFPFESRFVEIDRHKLHYIDEGKGDVILFVHGSPEWSFTYRDQIRSLSDNFRCIALDHLGFGLSDKPVEADYSSKAQYKRLIHIINKLQLKNINLVSSDFGGPIALAYAIENPENINKISIFNTWMWSLKGDKHYSIPGKFIQTWAGKFLYKKLNFPVNFIMPQAYGNRSKLTKEIHSHYRKPLSKSKYRNGIYAFGKDIINASDWWENLWSNLDRIIDKQFLILWGMKDKFILPKELDKWTDKLPKAKVVKYENAGHFLQEEVPEELAHELNSFFD